MSPRKAKFLAALLLVVLGPVIGLLSYQRWAVAHLQRQLVRAGEKLSIDELLPKPSLRESNGAALFRETFYGWGAASTNLLSTNPPLAMCPVAPGKAMAGWAQPQLRGAEATNSWSQLEAALAACGDTLELVRETAQRPLLDFQLDYRQGFSLPLYHLAPLKLAQQRLSSATLWELHAGHPAAAFTNLQAMLGLVKAAADEPLVISQLVRLALLHIAQAATWELLQAPNLSEEQLARLQGDWSQLQVIGPALKAMEFERALSQMSLERMRHSSTEFRQMLGLGGGGFSGSGASGGATGQVLAQNLALGTQEACWRLFLSYPDELRALKVQQVLLESLRQVQAGGAIEQAARSQRSRLSALGLKAQTEDSSYGFCGTDLEMASLFTRGALSMSGVLSRVHKAEAARRLTLTALALKRYQLGRGHYPAQLAELVPLFLDSAPLDPADALPLRYRLQPDGSFVLYSIGEDGVDNGGDATPTEHTASPNWQKARDWLWPQPASPQELDAYWQSGSKKHRR